VKLYIPHPGVVENLKALRLDKFNKIKNTTTNLSVSSIFFVNRIKYEPKLG